MRLGSPPCFAILDLNFCFYLEIIVYLSGDIAIAHVRQHFKTKNVQIVDHHAWKSMSHWCEISDITRHAFVAVM